MRFTKDEAFAFLSQLGTARWDTNPPEQGRIKWFDSNGELIAEGDYRVILSVGPGALYTMGYAVPSYSELGIPFVKQLDDLPSVVSDLTSDSQIWQRAESVGELDGADFVYQCKTLLVAVHGFRQIKQEVEK